MAFTSKVVILLVISSFAWWQASAEGGSAKTIIENLNNLTMITKAIKTEFKATDLYKAIAHLGYLREGLQGIVKAFVLGNDRLKMVSDPISDGVTVVEAVEILVAALEKLAKAMAKIFSRLRSLPSFQKTVAGFLLKLRMAAQEYGENLEKLLLTPSQKVAVGELFRKLGIVLLDAAEGIMPKE